MTEATRPRGGTRAAVRGNGVCVWDDRGPESGAVTGCPVVEGSGGAVEDDEVRSRFDGRAHVELLPGGAGAAERRRIDEIAGALGYRLSAVENLGFAGMRLRYERDDDPRARRRAGLTVERLRSGGPLLPAVEPPVPPPPASPPPAPAPVRLPPRQRTRPPSEPPPPPPLPAAAPTRDRVPPRPPRPPPRPPPPPHAPAAS
ncbi:hypothetical protein [Streptomyces lavendulocolor]|uniref:hypothetical protein n=1 Tax=Streptomyces lavendulocolor TaxID=67316 RepID=UPI0031D8F227